MVAQAYVAVSKIFGDNTRAGLLLLADLVGITLSVLWLMVSFV